MSELTDTLAEYRLTPGPGVVTWRCLRCGISGSAPTDTRNRVDAHGGVWRYNKDFDGWECENGIRHYTLEVADRHDGPLRFADEVSDR